MVEIDKRRIEIYLEVASYPKENQVLKTLKVDYPEICGTFILPPTFYLTKPLNHLSDLEVGICLNQLSYIGFMEALKLNQIPCLIPKKVTRIPYESAVIIHSEKRFKKMIDPSKEIHGRINAKRLFNLENSVILLTDFSFEDGKCAGKLHVSLIKKASKKTD